MKERGHFFGTVCLRGGASQVGVACVTQLLFLHRVFCQVQDYDSIPSPGLRLRDLESRGRPAAMLVMQQMIIHLVKAH